MSEQTLSFNPTSLGRWTAENRFTVTRERITSYAKATNDPIATHLAGDLASPVFAIVAGFDTLLEPALDVVPHSLLGQIVHSQQDFRFHRPISPEDELVTRAMMTGYQPRRSGTAVTVYLESRDQAGALVNEQYVTFLVRGFDAGENVGEPAPDHRMTPTTDQQIPLSQTSQHVDTDQTFRYAPAAGDHMPIHLDEDVARAAGLPGIILHGLCTLAFTSWAALTELAESDVRRLRRLAVRFSAPVLPGQELHTRFWDAASAHRPHSYTFETTTADATVLKDGLIELTDQ